MKKIQHEEQNARDYAYALEEIGKSKHQVSSFDSCFYPEVVRNSLQNLYAFHPTNPPIARLNTVPT